MCNLNFMVKKKGNASFLSPLQWATGHSYARNKDSEGVYLSSMDAVVKSENKVDLAPYEDQIAASNVVAIHERLSTSGKTLANGQPFMNERFVFMHNGVLSLKARKEKQAEKRDLSDSAMFFEEFLKAFEETEKVPAAIEAAFKKCVTSGSWSMFLYDKLVDRVYYFKNASTSMEIAKLKDGSIYGTTSSENLAFFDVSIKYELESDKLYFVDLEENSDNEYALYYNPNKLKIEEATYATTTSWGSLKGGYSGYYGTTYGSSWITNEERFERLMRLYNQEREDILEEDTRETGEFI